MHECPWIIKAIRETGLQLLQTLIGWHLQRTPIQESEDWILIPTVALRTQALTGLPPLLQVIISVTLNMSSVRFSCSVVSDSLWPYEPQHARPPCPSPTPGVYSNSHPSSWWCHPVTSPSVVPFSSCPQSSQHQGLFQWVNFSHEVAKVLEFQLQHQSLKWTPRTDLLYDGLVGSSCSPKGLSRIFSNTIVQKH